MPDLFSVSWGSVSMDWAAKELRPCPPVEWQGYCTRRWSLWAQRAPSLIPLTMFPWCLPGTLHASQPTKYPTGTWWLVGLFSLVCPWDSALVLTFWSASKFPGETIKIQIPWLQPQLLRQYYSRGPPKSVLRSFPGDSYAYQGLRITGVWGETYGIWRRKSELESNLPST